MTNFEKFCKELEDKIKAAYEERVTPDQAEVLAAEFLGAMIAVSRELRLQKLDSRMRKHSVKSVRGAIYLDVVGKSEKKPTEAGIAALVDTNELVQAEEKVYSEADEMSNETQRTYEICHEAHIYFRGVAKGSMG